MVGGRVSFRSPNSGVRIPQKKAKMSQQMAHRVVIELQKVKKDVEVKVKDLAHGMARADADFSDPST